MRSAPTRSKSQLFQILFLTSPSIACQHTLPEGVIISSGFDRQRHGDAPAEEEHFFLRLEPGKHATQGIPARKTGEYSVDIVLIAEPAADARPELGEYLVVDL